MTRTSFDSQTAVRAESQRPRFRLPEMEGSAARRYDRLRGSAAQLEGYRERAGTLSAGLDAGADVLEIAPGPGYFAIEMARRGARVTGLDISHTMVEIAQGHARDAGLAVDFRQGDATELPFADASFDLIVCQAAFKNFLEPRRVLDEMHRVLRPGAVAVIDDMRHEATLGDIRHEVRGMHVGPVNELITGVILWGLRRRAKSRMSFEQLARESAFETCEIAAEGVGMEVRLRK